jgi:hypothetical protein
MENVPLRGRLLKNRPLTNSVDQTPSSEYNGNLHSHETGLFYVSQMFITVFAKTHQ